MKETDEKDHRLLCAHHPPLSPLSPSPPWSLPSSSPPPPLSPSPQIRKHNLFGVNLYTQNNYLLSSSQSKPDYRLQLFYFARIPSHPQAKALTCQRATESQGEGCFCQMCLGAGTGSWKKPREHSKQGPSLSDELGESLMRFSGCRDKTLKTFSLT